MYNVPSAARIGPGKAVCENITLIAYIVVFKNPLKLQ